jgi:apolipoprotein D and lipocalin family protein
MKNILKIGALGSLVLFGLAAAAAGQVSSDPPTVASVDLDRYTGRWYEIAKYPNKFQKQCVANTVATYKKKPNGRLEVVNECLRSDGTKNTAVGEAKITKGSNNTKLKVRFAPGFLSFLSAVWGDYWVIDLGRDYEYAVIGEPKREYLWILSRKPEMGDALYQQILRRVETLGFVPSRVERTRQQATVLKGTVTGSD